MYATFRDKEALFRLATARYTDGPAACAREALNKQPTARGVVEALLRGALELLNDPSHARGFLSVQGALACGSDAESINGQRSNGEGRGSARFRSVCNAREGKGTSTRTWITVTLPAISLRCSLA
jgi:hypothetical protein